MKRSRLFIIFTLTLMILLLTAIGVSASESRTLNYNVSSYDPDTFERTAGAGLREAIKDRIDTVYVKLTGNNSDVGNVSSWANTISLKLTDIAQEHTGVPDEGDYIRFHLSEFEYGLSGTSDSNTFDITITYNFVYNSTAAQEAEVDSAVASVISSLNLERKDDYTKLSKIYEWICTHVTYDNAHRGNAAYRPQYTAYAAIINGTAVCQGYANLLYRMCLEAGIDCRIISGTGKGVTEDPAGGPHAWNIVKLGELYYYVDSTWDSTSSFSIDSTNWYLYGDDTNSFTNTHIRNASTDNNAINYTTSQFYSRYPMAMSSYVYNPTYKLTVSIDDSEHGEVYIVVPGVYTAENKITEYSYTLGNLNEIVNIVAVPSVGFGFVNWTDDYDSSEFSEDASSSFTLVNNIESSFTAHFVSVHVHNLVTHNAKEATCEEAGNTLYYSCEGCGKFFSDADATTEITENSWVIPATGHIWGTPEYEWSLDNSTATAKRICTKDSTHIETETVNTTSTTTAATCEDDGQTVYTATFTNPAFETQTKTVVIEALNHDWNTPTYEWSSDNKTVTAKRTCKHDSSHIETETVNTTSVTTDATCEDDGQTVYTAAFTNPAFETQTKTVIIDHLGHNWGSVEYTWAADNSTVTANRTCSRNHEHIETETVATTSETTSPTCENTGKTVYTAQFSNPAFETQTKTVVIDALNHDWNTPTYEWSSDNKTVTAKRTCKHDSSHIETETVNTTSVTTDATCEDDGQTVYTAAFTNPAFETQTKTVIIDHLGHNWGSVEYTWAADNSTVTANRTCSRNHEHIETETVATTSETTSPTCESTGKTVYTAQFSNPAFETQTKTVIIDALSHNWGSPTYEWSDDNSKVKATIVCLNDSTHIITETVNTTSMTTAATCEDDGQTVYTAAFTNPAFETQTKTVVIDALNHDWAEPEYGWSADNSTVTATRICQRDHSHIETETVTTNVVTTEPTCEADGSTTYTAVFSNPAFSVQTKIIVITGGHIWGTPSYEWSADNSTVKASRICGRDHSHVDEETVFTTVTTTPATCESDGQSVYTAVFTNSAFETQTKTVVIDALNHDWGEATYTWADDYSKVTAKRICQRDHSHIETETVNTTISSTEATCTTAGTTTYTATFTNPAFETQSQTVTIIIGHDWAEPTYEWSADNSTVTATRICQRDSTHIETETVSTTSSTTAPTCEEDGQTVYTAKFTNTAFETQTKTVVIDALEHIWGEVSYVWSADNSSVTATRICSRDGSHIDTETVNTTADTTNATCTSAGQIVYTAVFTNPAFETQTKTVVIDVLNHDWAAPTYEWSTDNSTVTASRICQRDHSHIETETVATTPETTDPTCEEDGKTVYTAVFTNPAFETQTKTVKIDALKHLWGPVTYEWAVDNSTVTASRICQRDHSHIETETVATTPETTDPTCEKDGKTVYTAVFTNPAFETQTKTVKIDALEHLWGTVIYEWSTNNSTVTASRICQRDNSHIETETVNTTSVISEPSCETAGEAVYTATFTNSAFETQTKTVVLLPLNHDWGEATYEWSADNTTVTASTVCQRDNTHVETETTTTTSVTTPATCEEDGSTVYTAVFTKTVFETQTKTIIIDALEHNWGTVTYEWATDYSSITASRTCQRDASHIETETVQTSVDITPATCETAGQKVYTAEFTNPAFETQTETVVIDALKHDWGNPIYEWTDDNLSVTARRICRHDETHVETETVNTSFLTSDATCEDEGSVVYTAVFTNPAFETQTKTVITDTLGHLWNNATYEWSSDNSHVTATRICSRDSSHVESETVAVTKTVSGATCTEKGTVTLTAVFNNSGFETQTKTMESDPLGHDIKHYSRMEPTCENPGHTEYYYCERCGRYFSDSEGNTQITKASIEIAPVGHEWDEGKIIKTATENWDGLIRYTCKHNPTHIKEEVIPKLNRDKDMKWYYIGQILRKLAEERRKQESDSSEHTEDEWVNPFTDINKNDKYYDAVKFVNENGLFIGVSDTKFAPENTMTRAMFVTVLGRLAGVDVSEYKSTSFSDVSTGLWYSEYVEWAAEQGIVLGYGDGTFGPEKLITREQAILIIQRYVNKCGITTESSDISDISDYESVSKWAYEAVSWGVQNDIYVLEEDGTINPKGNASRANVAMLVFNLVKLLGR